MSFNRLLDDVARRTGSLLCIGLDPHPADLPAPTAEAAREFCLRLIAETEGLAMAYKPNAAFFEAYGPAGWAALADVIAAVPAGIPVILDAKRGDIASTAEAYARSTFEQLGATAVTLNPYLGRDSLAPFIRDPQHGAFLLCKTSNPGAGDLQDLRLASGETVYEQVALLAQQWNENDNVALVGRGNPSRCAGPHPGSRAGRSGSSRRAWAHKAATSAPRCGPGSAQTAWGCSSRSAGPSRGPSPRARRRRRCGMRFERR